MGWPLSNGMRPFSSLAFVAALALGGIVSTACASEADSASIVNSGSTNSAGFQIDVRSDGAAVVTLKPHPGSNLPAGPKPFTVAPALTASFFADLKAVRDGNVAGAPCMKSASFGSSTHVSWHDWKSPDLECPSPNAKLNALIHDVGAIRDASGIGALPGIRSGEGGPPHVQPSPSPGPARASPGA
jgi:hypothetical protein